MPNLEWVVVFSGYDREKAEVVLQDKDCDVGYNMGAGRNSRDDSPR